ncbi:methyltransferase domain-containing protein [Methyloligella sp. 2.7D]|uniref:class I SAM-dependent methyltransferase n=1 Tax=unclassified Methyloligella TaxID=2625955 RepID=UPI00157D327F|nr:methyltransferase domain-containing protein [Methyloligella sp. GL2]QKP76462.1 methyltransferase domain-containing protein [Methyloligella sp. GL2]
MRVDVVDLREFYTSPLGHVVKRLLGPRLRARWGDLQGMHVFGLGYCSPYLGQFRDEAATLGALMPARQGVISWPNPGPRQSVLVEEDDLPLLDGTADRILIAHLLESADDPEAVLREAWRVLAPHGRLLVIAPYRTGLWARVENTPFGFGRPFSRTQLAKLLKDAGFTPEGWQHALYMPPFNWRFLLRWCLFWERLGLVLWPAFSGVIMVEATKLVYGGVPEKSLRRRAGRLIPVPAAPAVAPFGKNARSRSPE